MSTLPSLFCPPHYLLSEAWQNIVRHGKTVTDLSHSRGSFVCWLKPSKVTLCRTPDRAVFVVITLAQLMAEHGMTMQTKAFTFLRLSVKADCWSWSSHSINRELKPWVSSDTDEGLIQVPFLVVETMLGSKLPLCLLKTYLAIYLYIYLFINQSYIYTMWSWQVRVSCAAQQVLSQCFIIFVLIKMDKPCGV